MPVIVQDGASHSHQLILRRGSARRPPARGDVSRAAGGPGRIAHPTGALSDPADEGRRYLFCGRGRPGRTASPRPEAVWALVAVLILASAASAAAQPMLAAWMERGGPAPLERQQEGLSPEELLARADRLYDANDCEGARELYRKFASLYPDHPSARYARKLASACEEQAVVAGEQAQRGRVQPGALAREAQRLLDAGLWKDAVSKAREALLGDPGDQLARSVKKAAEARLEPPGTFVEEKGGATFVPVALGSFVMGCTPGDRDCDGDEKPAHTVELTRPFYMAKTETTNAQYRRCVEAEACEAPQDRHAFEDPSHTDHPVVFVSWSDATSFCQWIGGRLPTEAEWEYTARGAVVAARYPWGNEDPVCHPQAPGGAKFDDGGRCNDTGTEPAASFSANSLGVYDAAGNVWEWVDDWYDESYYGRAPRADPSGPSSGTLRIMRGGSWLSAPVRLRVTNRLGSHPGSQLQNAGFRCARSAEPVAEPDDLTPLSRRQFGGQVGTALPSLPLGGMILP